MDAIISPVWFYLIYVLNAIHGLSLFILFASVFATIMPILVDWPDEKKVMYIKICAVVATICLILLVFIPDKKTVYAMIAASVITPDNISITEDHVVDLISRIAEVVRETK